MSQASVNLRVLCVSVVSAISLHSMKTGIEVLNREKEVLRLNHFTSLLYSFSFCLSREKSLTRDSSTFQPCLLFSRAGRLFLTVANQEIS